MAAIIQKSRHAIQFPRKSTLRTVIFYRFTDSANTFTFPQLSTLRPTTEDEVLKLISRSPSKSSRLDPIPTWFLKEDIFHLLPVLTHILNLSLSSGIFQSGAHSAIIKPLLKKTSLDKKKSIKKLQTCVKYYISWQTN